MTYMLDEEFVEKLSPQHKFGKQRIFRPKLTGFPSNFLVQTTGNVRRI
jgi:hypothetical protein